jgi:hypothetical protein
MPVNRFVAGRRVYSKELCLSAYNAALTDLWHCQSSLLFRIFRSTQRTPSSAPPVYFLEC